MKHLKKIILSIVLFLGVFISYSLSASAATGWTLKGDAYKIEGEYVLTDVQTTMVGGYLKKAPIDTRKKWKYHFPCMKEM